MQRINATVTIEKQWWNSALDAYLGKPDYVVWDVKVEPHNVPGKVHYCLVTSVSPPLWWDWFYRIKRWIKKENRQQYAATISIQCSRNVPSVGNVVMRYQGTVRLPWGQEKEIIFDTSI